MTGEPGRCFHSRVQSKTNPITPWSVAQPLKARLLVNMRMNQSEPLQHHNPFTMQISRPNDFPGGECRPLNIIKQARPRANPTGSPSKMNMSTSTDMDESAESIPSSPGLDQPLTVVKKRAKENQPYNSPSTDSSSHLTQPKGVIAEGNIS